MSLPLSDPQVELWDAVIKKDYEKIKTAILRGGNVNLPYNKNIRGQVDSGISVLTYLIRSRDLPVEFLHFLIEAGADVNFKTIPLQNTALHFVVFRQYYDMDMGEKFANVLIDAGADVNAINSNSETPLYTASAWGNLEIVKLFLSKGTDINIRTDKGYTVYAASRPNVKAIIMEHEKQKWNTLLEEGKFSEIDQLDYRDKEIKDEHNKFLNKFKVSAVDQVVKNNKFLQLDTQGEFDFAQALMEQFEEGGGKKRRKTVRKHKKKKSRRGKK